MVTLSSHVYSFGFFVILQITDLMYNIGAYVPFFARFFKNNCQTRMIKLIYDYWAFAGVGGVKKLKFSCMNYGIIDDGKSTLADLLPEEEDERCQMNMYHFTSTSNGHHELKGKDVVEVGSGQGGGGSFLGRYLEPATYLGVELSQQAVKVANTRASRPKNVSFMVGDAQCLPLPSSSADVLVNIESSFYYPDFSKFLNEVHRVLRPGGYFCITDMRSVGDDLESFQNALRNHSGFSLVQNIDVTPRVVASLKNLTATRTVMLRENLPQWSWKMWEVMCGFEEGSIFKALANGTRKYQHFCFQKKQ